MVITIKTIGAVFVGIGILYLLKPEILRQLMQFFKKGSLVYLSGLLRFALAVIFLLGARECHRLWVIFTFGIIFIISGLLVFLFGVKRIRTMIDWYQEQPNWIFRVIALIVLAAGAIIIFSA